VDNIVNDIVSYVAHHVPDNDWSTIGAGVLSYCPCILIINLVYLVNVNWHVPQTGNCGLDVA
jgi:hypothetical protein